MTVPMHGRAPLAALRLASRLARREVLRRTARTALTALLIAVPVAAMVVASAFFRTEHLTAAESWESQHGTADAALSMSAGEPAPELLTALPAGSRVVSYRTAHRLLKTRDGDRATASVHDMPLDDPLMSGIFQILRGRAPATDDEVFLSRRTAAQLGVGVGDTLELLRPAEVALTVVGVGERRAWWEAEIAAVVAGSPLMSRAEEVGSVHVVDLPDGYDPTPLLHAAGDHQLELAPRYRAGSPVSDGEAHAATEKVAWSWAVGALSLVVVGIVITCAFAASARRQLTILGQLAANGASPTVLRRMLLLQGAWTGVVGMAAGLVLATVALLALAPHMDRLLGRDVDPYTILAADLVPVALLGIGASTLAALIPARSMSVVPVLTALAGRRPLRPVPSWLTPAGAGLSAVGLGLLGLAVLGANTATSAHGVWASATALGGVAVLLGGCIVSPGCVSALGRLASRLHGTWRIAARSLVRQRTRSAAVVAAICATAALTIAAGALSLGAVEKLADDPKYMPDNQVHVSAWRMADSGTGESRQSTAVGLPEQLLADIGAVLDAERHVITTFGPPRPDLVWHSSDPGRTARGGFYDRLAGERAVLADAAAAAVYRLTDEQMEVGRRAGALLVGDFTAPAATVTWASSQHVGGSGLTPSVQSPAPRELTAATVAGAGKAPGALPALLLTEPTASRLGLVPSSDTVVFVTANALSPSQRLRLAELSEDLQAHQVDNGPTEVQLNITWQTPSGDLPPLLLEGLLTGATLVFALAIIAASLALAAAETRDERDLLVMVGAPPRTLAGVSGQKALLLTLLGAALALPVGLLPVAVFTSTSDAGVPMVVPWRTVGLLLTAVPAVVAAVAAAGSLLSMRFRPTRMSTMAFE